MSFRCAHINLDVLPKGEIPLSGLYQRAPNSQHIGIEECRLKIVWFSFSDKEQIIFLLADYLFFPNRLAEKCLDYLSSTFSISRNQVILAGTHSHSGPALGFLPWESEQPAYIQEVFNKIKLALPKLKSNLESASISVGNSRVEGINVNRRKLIRHWRKLFKRQALMLPNPTGLVNEKVKGILVEYASGKKLSLLSFASHPVFNRNLKYSSDYPGLLSTALIKNKFADEVLVFQGFGGDIRPNYQKRKELGHQIKALFYGNDFADYKPEHAFHFVKKLETSVKSISWISISQNPKILINKDGFNLNSQTKKHQHQLTFRKFSIGENINIFLANAEMFVQYENKLPASFFPISCTQHCIGYVPGANDLKYGGYEVSEAPLNNNSDSAYLKADILKVEDYIEKLSSD